MNTETVIVQFCLRSSRRITSRYDPLVGCFEGKGEKRRKERKRERGGERGREGGRGRERGREIATATWKKADA